jgi:sugar phosphate isomerase/epimerase
MMISRRQWMAGGAALATTLAAGPLLAKTMKPKRRPIGVQLYTVRELFSRDPMGTLEKVAAIGYREVEYGGGGYDKMDHAALRKTMDRLGLVSPSIHVGYEALAADFDGAVKIAKTLGADTLVVPYMADAHRTEAGWKAAVADFNRYAERLKKAGIDFAYHNHDFEFTLKPGGRSLFDTLVADADPALVKIELDLFWAVAAGEDPKAIIARLPGRIYAYHVKDRTADGKMTSVGKGVIDFADIFTLNKTAGVKHFYVENDQAPAPYLPDIQTSFATLSQLGA